MTETAPATDSAPMASPVASLWRHADFLKLWAGQTISLTGSQVTTLALPLTAVLVLHVSAFQMGALKAVQYSPFIVVSLAAGVWIDRTRRRTLLIASDIGRALLLASVPLAFLAGVRSIGWLYAVAFGVGVLTVIFNVAYQAHLPSLVDAEQLVDGNSKLEASRSFTQVVGPGLAGLLVQLVSPPLAIVVDALSFLVSAASLGAIRRPDPAPESSRQTMLSQLREGFAFIRSHPLVGPIVASCGLLNLAQSIGSAVFVLFLIRQLGFTPALLGVMFAVGGAGGLLGAATARRVVRAIGFGRSVTGSSLLLGLGVLATAVAGLVPGPAVALVTVAVGLQFYAIILYNVSLFTLWQTTTPGRLRGRVSATLHFIIWGSIPFGALAGGELGTLLSLRWSIAIGAVGILLAAAWSGLSVVGRVAAGSDAAAPEVEP